MDAARTEFNPSGGYSGTTSSEKPKLSVAWIAVIILCVLLFVALIVVVVLGVKGVIFNSADSQLRESTTNTTTNTNTSTTTMSSTERAQSFPKDSIERVLLEVPEYNPVSVTREEEKTVSREKPVIEHILNQVPFEAVPPTPMGMMPTSIPQGTMQTSAVPAKPKLSIVAPSTKESVEAKAPNPPAILPRKSSMSKILTFVPEPDSDIVPTDSVLVDQQAVASKPIVQLQQPNDDQSIHPSDVQEIQSNAAQSNAQSNVQQDQESPGPDKQDNPDNPVNPDTVHAEEKYAEVEGIIVATTPIMAASPTAETSGQEQPVMAVPPTTETSGAVAKPASPRKLIFIEKPESAAGPLTALTPNQEDEELQAVAGGPASHPNTPYTDPDGAYSIGSTHLSGLHRFIEYVVYINLDDDKAKRTDIEREIDKLGLPDFVARERLSAVKRSNSALGSFLSKIACLSKALSLKKNALILEDDFRLLQSSAEVMAALSVVEERFGNRWDVISFAQNVDEWQPVCAQGDVRVMRVLHSLSATGFLVNKLYVPRILAYWFQKLRSILHKEKFQEPYQLDSIKTDLQRSDIWLTFQFPLGCRAGERWNYMDDLEHSTNDMGVCQRVKLAPRLERKRVAVCHMATGKYNQFITAIQNDCYLKFLKMHEMEFFLFTDDPASYSDHTEEGAKLHTYPIVGSKGYPRDNLYRFHHIMQAANELQAFDFVFYMDSDYRLYQHPAETQLMIEKGVVATAHLHNIVEKRDGSKRHIGAPETRPDSTACIRANETMTTYFAGSFHGGATGPYLEMCRTIRDNVDTDDRNGITAKWLDESHLNRYLMDHPPQSVLSQSYIFSEKCLNMECLDPVCVSLRESRIQPVMGSAM